MDIDYKIKNLREVLDDEKISFVNNKIFFSAILDIFQDISKEIDEINEMIYV